MLLNFKVVTKVRIKSESVRINVKIIHLARMKGKLTEFTTEQPIFLERFKLQFFEMSCLTSPITSKPTNHPTTTRCVQGIGALRDSIV